MPSVYDSAGIPKASGGGAGGGIALSAAGGLISSGTALFSDVNGVSWGRAGQTITGSVAAGATATGNFGALSAGGGLVSSGTASFVNANGVTFTNNAQSFSASVAMQTFSNVGGQNITFGLSGGTALTASVAAPGGGGGATMYNWPFQYVSTSSGPTMNSGTTGNTGASTQSTASFTIYPWQLEAPLNFSRLKFALSFGVGAAGTGSWTWNLGLGFYTLTGSTLDLVSSFRWRDECSQNSVTALTHRYYWGTNSTSNSTQISGNISAASVTGIRPIVMWDGATASLPAAQYYLVSHWQLRTSNLAAGTSLTRIILAHRQHDLFSDFGTGGTDAAHNPFLAGAFSSTTNTNNLTAVFMPSSIHTSVISGSFAAVGVGAIFFDGSHS